MAAAIALRLQQSKDITNKNRKIPKPTKMDRKGHWRQEDTFNNWASDITNYFELTREDITKPEVLKLLGFYLAGPAKTLHVNYLKNPATCNNTI